MILAFDFYSMGFVSVLFPPFLPSHHPEIFFTKRQKVCSGERTRVINAQVQFIASPDREFRDPGENIGLNLFFSFKKRKSEPLFLYK
jgi:hypothetical protein